MCLEQEGQLWFLFIVISPVVEILCSRYSHTVLDILIRFDRDINQVRLCARMTVLAMFVLWLCLLDE